MRYMLDTDISIYLIKNHPPALRERFDSLRGELCISVITLGELRFGAEKSARRMQNIAAVEGYTQQLQVMPFTSDAAAHFGELRAHLARAGTRGTIRPADQRPCPQRRADPSHQQCPRIRPHVGPTGRELDQLRGRTGK